VIAAGSPQDLIGSIGDGHVLEYSSSASPATLRVQVRDLHLAVPAILQDLDRQSHRLTELRMRSTTLEDVFITLTGRRLRDE
jgi:ABC-2 type transport system ATP-binding protein